jgi:hypothetical protein
MPPEQALAILKFAQLREGVPINVAELMKLVEGDYEKYTGDIETAGADWMKDLMGTAYDPSDPNAAMFANDPTFSSYAGGLAQMGETADMNLASDQAWFRKNQEAQEQYYNDMMVAISTGALPIGAVAAAGGGGGGGGGGGYGGGGYGGGGGSGGGGDYGDNGLGIGDTKTTVQDKVIDEFDSTTVGYENYPDFADNLISYAESLGDPEIVDNVTSLVYQYGAKPQDILKYIEEEQISLDAQNETYESLEGTTDPTTGQETPGTNDLWLAAQPAELRRTIGEYLNLTGNTLGDDPSTTNYVEPYYGGTNVLPQGSPQAARALELSSYLDPILNDAAQSGQLSTAVSDISGDVRNNYIKNLAQTYFAAHPDELHTVKTVNGEPAPNTNVSTGLDAIAANAGVSGAGGAPGGTGSPVDLMPNPADPNQSIMDAIQNSLKGPPPQPEPFPYPTLPEPASRPPTSDPGPAGNGLVYTPQVLEQQMQQPQPEPDELGQLIQQLIRSNAPNQEGNFPDPQSLIGGAWAQMNNLNPAQQERALQEFTDAQTAAQNYFAQNPEINPKYRTARGSGLTDEQLAGILPQGSESRLPIPGPALPQTSEEQQAAIIQATGAPDSDTAPSSTPAASPFFDAMITMAQQNGGSIMPPPVIPDYIPGGTGGNPFSLGGPQLQQTPEEQAAAILQATGHAGPTMAEAMSTPEALRSRMRGNWGNAPGPILGPATSEFGSVPPPDEGNWQGPIPPATINGVPNPAFQDYITTTMGGVPNQENTQLPSATGGSGNRPAIVSAALRAIQNRGSKPIDGPGPVDDITAALGNAQSLTGLTQPANTSVADSIMAGQAGPNPIPTGPKPYDSALISAMLNGGSELEAIGENVNELQGTDTEFATRGLNPIRQNLYDEWGYKDEDLAALTANIDPGEVISRIALDANGNLTESAANIMHDASSALLAQRYPEATDDELARQAADNNGQYYVRPNVTQEEYEQNKKYASLIPWIQEQINKQNPDFGPAIVYNKGVEHQGESRDVTYKASTYSDEGAATGPSGMPIAANPVESINPIDQYEPVVQPDDYSTEVSLGMPHTATIGGANGLRPSVRTIPGGNLDITDLLRRNAASMLKLPATVNKPVPQTSSGGGGGGSKVGYHSTSGTSKSSGKTKSTYVPTYRSSKKVKRNDKGK